MTKQTLLGLTIVSILTLALPGVILAHEGEGEGSPGPSSINSSGGRPPQFQDDSTSKSNPPSLLPPTQSRPPHFSEDFKPLPTTIINQGSPSGQMHFQNVKEHASNLIDQRLNELTKVTSRLTSSTKLSDAEKQSLQTDIQNATNQLTQLKTNLANTASDSATKQTLKDNYNLLRYQPNLAQKVNLIIITDDLVNVLSKIQAVLQTKPDVASFSATQSSKLTTDTTLLQNDQALLLQTSISATNAQDTFKKVKADLVSVRNDFYLLKSNLKSANKFVSPPKFTASQSANQ